MTTPAAMPAAHRRTARPGRVDAAGRRCRSRGFTLVEVMVALIIIGIGMLGIAKMQGLALSSTSASRSRALAAIEASSLAAAMQANRAYWSASGSAPGTITVNTSANVATIVTTGTSAAMRTALAAVAGSLCTGLGNPSLSCYCATGVSAPCTSTVNMAANDVFDWSQSLGGVLPNATATVTCTSADLPVDCTITIGWTENVGSLTGNEAGAAQSNAASTATAAIQNVSYSLYVVP